MGGKLVCGKRRAECHLQKGADVLQSVSNYTYIPNHLLLNAQVVKLVTTILVCELNDSQL